MKILDSVPQGNISHGKILKTCFNCVKFISCLLHENTHSDSGVALSRQNSTPSGKTFL